MFSAIVHLQKASFGRKMDQSPTGGAKQCGDDKTLQFIKFNILPVFFDDALARAEAELPEQGGLNEEF